MFPRGYVTAGPNCYFPDNSSCPLDQFNNRSCGQRFFTQNYCVPQGAYVWDSDRCCPGLAPFLPAGLAGQTTCQPVAAQLAQPSVAMVVTLVIVMALIVGFVYWLMERKKKPKRRNNQALGFFCNLSSTAFTTSGQAMVASE